ncbi:unnamed protein product, partial [Didymodactylos carnosus]
VIKMSSIHQRLDRSLSQSLDSLTDSPIKHNHGFLLTTTFAHDQNGNNNNNKQNFIYRSKSCSSFNEDEYFSSLFNPSLKSPTPTLRSTTIPLNFNPVIEEKSLKTDENSVENHLLTSTYQRPSFRRSSSTSNAIAKVIHPDNLTERLQSRRRNIQSKQAVMNVIGFFKRLSSIADVQPDIEINGVSYDEQLFNTNNSYILKYADLTKSAQNLQCLTEQKKILEQHLYKVALILTLTELRSDKEVLLYQYPLDVSLDEIKNYKRFCFPELTDVLIEDSLVYDSSTFVFTRVCSDGKIEYGYCRRLHSTKSQIYDYPAVLCLISTYSCYKLYDAVLNELSNAYSTNELECQLLLQSFYSKPVPKPGVSAVVCVLNNSRVFFYAWPKDNRINHDYFAILLRKLSPVNVIKVFCAMLRSKRIICFAKGLSTLTKCCLGLHGLLYPFTWPYPFVSLMPDLWCRDICETPFPFFYGFLYSSLEWIHEKQIDDTVLVDLENNKLYTEFDDIDLLNVLPPPLYQVLLRSLEYIVRFRLSKMNENLLNIAVSEAFLRVFIELLYKLPDFFHRTHTMLADEDTNNSQFQVCKDYFNKDADRDSGIVIPSRTNSPATLSSVTTAENLSSSPSSASSSPNSKLLYKIQLDRNHPNKKPSTRRKSIRKFDYEFFSDDFLIAQSQRSYVPFLNEFIHGMMFMKFLDEFNYERDIQQSLFCKRLSEYRREKIYEQQRGKTDNGNTTTMNSLTNLFRQTTPSSNQNDEFREQIDTLEKYAKDYAREVMHSTNSFNKQTMTNFVKKLLE